MLRCLEDGKLGFAPMEMTVCVPNLRVAHETLAETDGDTVRLELAEAVGLGNGVHVGGVRGIDGVAFHALLRGDTPAIVDTGTYNIRSAYKQITRRDAHEADFVLYFDHRGECW